MLQNKKTTLSAIAFRAPNSSVVSVRLSTDRWVERRSVHSSRAFTSWPERNQIRASPWRRFPSEKQN